MKRNKNHIHKLFIKPILKSKSKSFFLFKPKEVIVAEPYELSLDIANLGNTKFPGGIIDSFTVKEGGSELRNIELEIKIPPLDKKEVFTTKSVKCVAVSEGVAWIKLKIKSEDNNVIEYCQLDRATDKYTILKTDDWHDYFHIFPHQELHQRFTNYLLLILTIVMILLMGIPILISLFDC